MLADSCYARPRSASRPSRPTTRSLLVTSGVRGLAHARDRVGGFAEEDRGRAVGVASLHEDVAARQVGAADDVVLVPLLVAPAAVDGECHERAARGVLRRRQL